MAELTVMTWNVQNLLPVGHADGPVDDGEYRSRLAALAAMIHIVGPDVLALQEVGPAQVLADLNEACAIDFELPDRRGCPTAATSGLPCCRRGDCRTSVS